MGFFRKIIRLRIVETACNAVNSKINTKKFDLFVEKALETVPPGNKVAMFLKLTFLEGQGRRSLFRDRPPQTVYVSSARLQCGKNGEFTGKSAVAYAWFVWRRGYPRPDAAKMA